MLKFKEFLLSESNNRVAEVTAFFDSLPETEFVRLIQSWDNPSYAARRATFIRNIATLWSVDNSRARQIFERIRAIDDRVMDNVRQYIVDRVQQSMANRRQRKQQNQSAPKPPKKTPSPKEVWLRAGFKNPYSIPQSGGVQQWMAGIEQSLQQMVATYRKLRPTDQQDVLDFIDSTWDSNLAARFKKMIR